MKSPARNTKTGLIWVMYAIYFLMLHIVQETRVFPYIGNTLVSCISAYSKAEFPENFHPGKNFTKSPVLVAQKLVCISTKGQTAKQ